MLKEHDWFSVPVTVAGYSPADTALFGTDGPRVASKKVGKGAVAELLGLTHLVDDRDSCLYSSFGEVVPALG